MIILDDKEFHDLNDMSNFGQGYGEATGCSKYGDTFCESLYFGNGFGLGSSSAGCGYGDGYGHGIGTKK